MLRVDLVKGDYCIFDNGLIKVVSNNGEACFDGRVISSNRIDIDDETPEEYINFIEKITMKCNVDVLREVYLNEAVILEDIQRVLKLQHNIKIICYDSYDICNMCGSVTGSKEYMVKSIRDLTDDEWNWTIGDINKDGIFTTIDIYREMKYFECSSCREQSAMNLDINSQEVESIYGDAFSNWNDFYNYKNGSSFCN